MLDRQYQKTQQPQQRQRGQAPPSIPATAGQWQQQYGAPAEEEDEEENDDTINLATLLNTLDVEYLVCHTHCHRYLIAVFSRPLHALR